MAVGGLRGGGGAVGSGNGLRWEKGEGQERRGCGLSCHRWERNARRVGDEG